MEKVFKLISVHFILAQSFSGKKKITVCIFLFFQEFIVCLAICMLEKLFQQFKTT